MQEIEDSKMEFGFNRGDDWDSVMDALFGEDEPELTDEELEEQEELNRDRMLESQELEDFEGLAYDDFPAGGDW